MQKCPCRGYFKGEPLYLLASRWRFCSPSLLKAMKTTFLMKAWKQTPANLQQPTVGQPVDCCPRRQSEHHTLTLALAASCYAVAGNFCSKRSNLHFKTSVLC